MVGCVCVCVCVCVRGGGGAVVICSPHRRCENIMFLRCPSVWLPFYFLVSMLYLMILLK